MKNIILSLVFTLLLVPVSYGANSITSSSDIGWGKKTVMSFDTTGRLCVSVGRGQYYWSSIFNASGTITYQWENALDTSPSAGESDELFSSDKSADDSSKITVWFPAVCVNVKTCTGCSLTATIYTMEYK